MNLKIDVKIYVKKNAKIDAKIDAEIGGYRPISKRAKQLKPFIQ